MQNCLGVLWLLYFQRIIGFKFLWCHLVLNVESDVKLDFSQLSLDRRLLELHPTYSEMWASLISQLVKNPPAMQDTLVQFLRWEDPLEKG